MQEIYVPTGQSYGFVKLTLVNSYANISQVCKYFQGIQDTFSAELETCETITQNLKIKCVSHAKCAKCPFYILEFNDVTQGFAVWKSGGEWKLGDIIASLYDTKTQLPKTGGTDTSSMKTMLFKAQNNKKHDPDAVWNSLSKLRVDWAKFDISGFWTQLDDLLVNEVGSRHCDSYAELVSSLQYRSFVVIALLKSKVNKNKQELISALERYNDQMHSQYANRGEGSDGGDSGNSESDKEIREPSLFDDTAELKKDYIFSSNQLATNFQKHFRCAAENFETFGVKKPRFRTPAPCRVTKIRGNSKTNLKNLA
ncbi:LAMI_0H14532g1_1 [Lachancea mirantina]|uniref:LAMI_0H14532g1_1 n=1 Tax=Lachancea mirantina TaxID=1230905 RepID=A0A1G4KI62_9SACH|nr:LAMI_0H14532g1_1 [Lachancea mirantina]